MLIWKKNARRQHLNSSYNTHTHTVCMNKDDTVLLQSSAVWLSFSFSRCERKILTDRQITGLRRSVEWKNKRREWERARTNNPANPGQSQPFRLLWSHRRNTADHTHVWCALHGSWDAEVLQWDSAATLGRQVCRDRAEGKLNSVQLWCGCGFKGDIKEVMFGRSSASCKSEGVSKNSVNRGIQRIF